MTPTRIRRESDGPSSRLSVLAEHCGAKERHDRVTAAPRFHRNRGAGDTRFESLSSRLERHAASDASSEYHVSRRPEVRTCRGSCLGHRTTRVNEMDRRCGGSEGRVGHPRRGSLSNLSGMEGQKRGQYDMSIAFSRLEHMMIIILVCMLGNDISDKYYVRVCSRHASRVALRPRPPRTSRTTVAPTHSHRYEVEATTSCV
jgi:hypothetical protein